jgi:hypothetical protein
MKATPVSLLLTRAEKNQLVKDIWLWPGIIMLVLIVGLWWAWGFAEVAHLAERQKTSDLIKLRDDSFAKLKLVSQEEQEIVRKSALFLKWQQRGAIGELNELNIQEFLYTLAKKHGVSEFEYLTSERGASSESLSTLLKQQISANTANLKNQDEGVSPPLSIAVLPQQLTLKVQHERQFFDFLTSITYFPESTSLKSSQANSPPPAFAKLQQCNLTRINPNSELSPTQVNFNASCTLSWLVGLRPKTALANGSAP